MANNFTVPVFGRLNWNISQEVSFTLAHILTWTDNICAIFEYTVIIFFIRSFCIKKSPFREPYFIIYTMGCFVDASMKMIAFLTTFVVKHILFWHLNSFFYWYNPNFIPLWNLLLALNRFVAILFTLQFSKIWSKRNTTIICIFLILYPFFLHSHNPVYMWCMISYSANFRTKMCMTSTFTNFEYVFAFISDIAYAISATVLCAIAALKIVIKKQMKNQNVEKVLLIQSFTSSVFLLLSTTFSWLATVNGSIPGEPDESEMYRGINLQLFLGTFSNVFYNVHHFVGLILLLVMSRNFRTNYFELYRISILLKWCTIANLPKSDATNTVVIVSPLSATATPRIIM